MKTLGWLLILTMALAGLSCAKKKHPDPKLWEVIKPQTRVLALTITEQTDTGFRAEARVELVNENRVELPLLRVHYQIDIQGIGSVSLMDEAGRTLPARGSQQIILPASFAWQGPVPTDTPWLVKGRVSYYPPGELRQIMTETKIPLPESSFEGQGSLK